LARLPYCLFLLVVTLTPAFAEQDAVPQAPKQPLNARAWEMLVTTATDPKPERRMEAISALGTMTTDHNAVRMVEGALIDKDRDVRNLAAVTLGEMWSRRSIPKLKQALEDEAPEVAFAAARSLWQLGDKSGRGIIEEVLGGDRSASRGAVSQNLGRMRKFVSDPKGLVLFGLREGIGSVAGPYAMGMTVVQEFTKDRSVAARVVSANMIANERSRHSLPLLLEALRDGNWVVRLTAAKGIAQLRDRSAIQALQGNIDDKDEKLAVKLMAAASILNLQK
jgi:HEAT repeat protein